MFQTLQMNLRTKRKAGLRHVLAHERSAGGCFCCHSTPCPRSFACATYRHPQDNGIAMRINTWVPQIDAYAGSAVDCIGRIEDWSCP
jgi:hypothetical protein